MTGELAALLRDLPPDLAGRALSHSSWVGSRTQAYGRLAFLGDSVLGLSVATDLFNRYPDADIGELTKVHNQAVSGRACAEVARQMQLPELLAERAPADGSGLPVATLVASERTLASVCEAVIGACYLQYGYLATAEATVAAFSAQVDLALETMLDFKSALQERLAREGARVTYAVTREAGPAHDRRFEVAARLDSEVIGTGEGRSKKAAEQAAAAEALERLKR